MSGNYTEMLEIVKRLQEAKAKIISKIETETKALEALDKDIKKFQFKMSKGIGRRVDL